MNASFKYLEEKRKNLCKKILQLPINDHRYIYYYRRLAFIETKMKQIESENQIQTTPVANYINSSTHYKKILKDLNAELKKRINGKIEKNLIEKINNAHNHKSKNKCHNKLHV